MSGSRRRWHPPLDPEDARLWEAVKATVAPLRKRDAPSADALPAARPRAPLRLVDPPPPRKRTVPPPLTTMERGLKRKVAHGTEPIGDRLDLHGLRQEEAHRRLLRFLIAAQVAGHRVVLVVTGKGDAMSGDPLAERGVLRRSVPLWLRLPEFRTLVVGIAPAERRHGGAGALYVHIRRGAGK
jgi:DNA-nicking Smr family endonuclease